MELKNVPFVHTKYGTLNLFVLGESVRIYYTDIYNFDLVVGNTHDCLNT